MFWLHTYGRSMGSLHVLCQQDRKIPYADPKGFRMVHVRAPYGFLWISYGLRNTIMCAGTVRMPWIGLWISVWSVVIDEVHEATFVLYLSGKTWFCASWPVGASTAPQNGLQAFYRHKIVGKPYVYKNTAPVRVHTSSKHRVGLHDMPCITPGPRIARELHVT